MSNLDHGPPSTKNELHQSVYGMLMVKNRAVKSSIEMLKSFNYEKLNEFMERDTDILYELGRKISPIARKNYDMERELVDMDHKIKLLVKHQITAADVIRDSAVLSQTGQNSNALGDRKELYEELFYLLATRPDYLAILSQRCPKIDQDDFVKTVIFDLFGDISDPRTETTLLTILRKGMEIEFSRHKESGSLFRDNKATMGLLKTYAHRGEGKSVIKDILAKPVREVHNQKNLVLEINVTKVYAQVIQKYENKTGKKWPRPRQVTTQQANESPFVQQLCNPRIDQLKFICDHFLNRITSNVQKIPWGVRWICKQFAELGAQHYPDATPFQIGSLVGGFIYLRLLNPAIVTPFANNFIESKPTKTTRRNLILVANVLQHLSNGVEFNESELFMVPMNDFLLQKRNTIQNYFAKLIDVDDLDFRRELVKLHQQHDQLHIVKTTLNQIYTMHRLCSEFRRQLCPDQDQNDPLLRVLVRLGEIPEKVPHKENFDVTMRLNTVKVETDEFETVEADRVGKETIKTLSISSFFGENVLPEVLDATSALKQLCKQLSIKNYKQLLTAHRRDFEGFLQGLISSNTVDSALACEVNEKICVAVDALQRENANPDLTYSKFISNYVDNIRSLHKRAKQLHEHVVDVKRAANTVKLQNKKLLEKIGVYEVYLQDVKHGGQRMEKSNTQAPRMKPVIQEKSFSHKELASMGVILDVAEEHRSDAKKLKYRFKRIAHQEYEIQPMANMPLLSFPVLDPVTVTILDLLRKEESYVTQFTVLGKVVLNVILLKKLLVKTFKE